jgi:hypothetical protein
MIEDWVLFRGKPIRGRVLCECTGLSSPGEFLLRRVGLSCDRCYGTKRHPCPLGELS